MMKTGTSLFQKILSSVNYFFLTSDRMRNKKMEVICFEHFQNYQYLKQSHLWKTLMIQVVSLALVFLKLVGFFTVHYRVNILQWFPRMNLVHCGLRNWGKSWIQRFLFLNLWLLIFSWSKMHFNKSSMRVPYKSNCLKMPHIQRLFVVDDFPIFLSVVHTVL